MGGRITEKIKLWGIVQGVGFRPFVAKCADKYGMKGEVLNIGGLVDIIVTDTEERIDAFVEAIKREKPVPAEIVHIKREVLGRERRRAGQKMRKWGAELKAMHRVQAFVNLMLLRY